MEKNDVLSRYERFKPIVEDVTRGLGSYTLLAEGAESKVWRAQLDGTEFVVKIAKPHVLNRRGRVKSRELMTQSKIISGIQATGIPGLEQFYTGLSTDYAVVFKFVHGLRLTSFYEDHLDMVTNDQKNKLLETIAKATEAGLTFDCYNPSGANAFYSPDDGFTLIDYESAWCPVSYDENWSCVMRSIGPVALRAFNVKNV